MSNPPVIQLTERRAKSAPLEAPAPADRQSEIIRLCVQYCQLLGAMDAGFRADTTGDCLFASAGRHLFRAQRLLPKLVALSPHMRAGAPPLTANELRAKAAVMQALYGLHPNEDLLPIERSFIVSFAGEVADYFDAQVQAQALLNAEDRRAAVHS